MTKENVKSLWAPGEIFEYERAKREQAWPLEGRVLEDVLVPPRGFLSARRLSAGQSVRFVDVEGRQVVDVVLYDASNLKNCSSVSNTILISGTYKITSGHSIYAKSGDKLATITQDTVGHTAIAGGFCNPHMVKLRYGIEGAHSCLMNLVASMAEFNLAPLDIEEGGCFCPFMNLEYAPDGSLTIHEPTSRPGDHFDLRADMDILVAVSNCPSEHSPCNGWNPSPVRVLVYEDSGPA